eukprot:TRINITY_DN26527_c0_g1_i1.p1 TRINITY_DN26527_c0_g1~~TRINITY_DN26527_c0_g1_i1.p1  ORF type:complete len:136 (-),score=26.98 TRINITY_DN26527_c0_g1_i1:141-548(-)
MANLPVLLDRRFNGPSFGKEEKPKRLSCCSGTEALSRIGEGGRCPTLMGGSQKNQKERMLLEATPSMKEKVPASKFLSTPAGHTQCMKDEIFLDVPSSVTRAMTEPSPYDLAQTALEAFKERQQRIAGRTTPFVV